MLIIIILLPVSCTKNDQDNSSEKNINPKISIRKDGIEIRNSTDTFSYKNYEIIVNGTYSADLVRKPEMAKGDGITVPYYVFSFPSGTVIQSVTFKMPDYKEFTVTQKIEARGNLSGFLDIQWGSNTNVARTILQRRGNTDIRIIDKSVVAIENDEEEGQQQIYWADQKIIQSNGEYAGYRSAQISGINLYFYKDKLYRSEITVYIQRQYTLETAGSVFQNLYDYFSKRHWETILSTSETYPEYAWLFDNNCVIILRNESSEGDIKIIIEYIERETFDMVERLHNG